MLEWSSGRYTVIYADPPWSYRDRRDKPAVYGGNPRPRMQGGAAAHYPTMALDDIKSLPVPEIAADDAVLFLWATAPLLPEAIEVMQAWGFEYKTVGFVWVKTNRRSGTPFLGMGHWTRANAEFCLLGVRGKPKRVDATVRSVVIAPVREHSRKPDEVRERIERLMGDVPRIELFARERPAGWDVWGLEVPDEETNIAVTAER